MTYEAFDVTKSTRCRFNYAELREYSTSRGISHGRQCGAKNEGRPIPLNYYWPDHVMLCYCNRGDWGSVLVCLKPKLVVAGVQ